MSIAGRFSALSLCLFAVLPIAPEVVAADWDTSVDGQSLVPERLSRGSLEPFDHPQILAAGDSWWLLGDPSVFSRRLVARFAHNTTDVVAATVVADRFTPNGVALSDGDLAVTLNRDALCPFDATACSSAATLERRSPDASLRWSRSFSGPCSTPVERGSTLLMACATQLYRLDADGYTLERKALGGTSGEEPPVLIDLADDSAESNDLLLLAHDAQDQASLRRFDDGLNQLWRRDWDEQLSYIGVSAGSAYFSAAARAIEDAVSQSIYGIALSNGRSSLGAEVAGTVDAAQTFGGVVYAIVSSAASTQQTVVAIRQTGQSTLVEPERQVFPQALLATNDGVLLASYAVDGVKLTRFGLQDEVRGIRAFGRARGVLRLHRTGPGTYALVSWPRRNARFPTVELLSFQGERLTPSITSVLAPLGTPGGEIDPVNQTLWVGDQTSTLLGDFLSRSAFDGTPSAVFQGAATTEYSARVLLGPSKVGDRFCVARVPGPIFPQPSSSGVSDLLCAPRTGDEAAATFALTLPGVSAFGIALGESDQGLPKILSSKTSLNPGFELFSTAIDFDGTAQTQSGGTVESLPSSFFSDELFNVNLASDLSGLIGNSVIDAQAQELFRVQVPFQSIRRSWRLSDGGWLLDVAPGAQLEDNDFTLIRLNADGVQLWQRQVDVQSANVGQVVAVEQGDSLVVELSLFPGPGATGERVSIDSLSGAITQAPVLLKDAQATGPLVSLDPANAARGVWRLRPAGSGILAEPIATPSAPYWLPCGMQSCAIEAQTVGDNGSLLAKLSGSMAAGYQNRLVSVDLDSLNLAASAPGDPARPGRWHDEQSALAGMVVGIDPDSRRLQRYWLGTGGSDANGQAKSQWWRLNAQGSIGPAQVQQIQFPGSRGLAAATTANMNLVAFNSEDAAALLRPLMDGELYLNQTYEQRLLDPLSPPGRLSTHHRLQRRADTLQTRLYLASADQWIAVDMSAGEGVWARPDGRWYRLRKDSGERWVVARESESAFDSSRDFLPERTADIAEGQLRVNACGAIEWRLRQYLTNAERPFDEAFQPRRYESGGPCR